MFLRLAVPLTATCLFSCSKKILTLDMKQDPPPHPNTLRLQRMIRYSATLFVQVKPLLSTTQEGGRGPWLACSLFAHLPLFRVTCVSATSRENLHVRGK